MKLGNRNEAVTEVESESAKSLRKAESILNLIQEPSQTNRPVPMLTRDEDSCVYGFRD